MAETKEDQEDVGPLVVCGPNDDPLDIGGGEDKEQNMTNENQQQEADSVSRQAELEAIFRDRMRRAEQTGSYSGIIVEGDEIRDIDPPSDPSYGRRLL